MARARKLFPSYGSALAMNLLTKLERERVVHEFVMAYVADYERPGILGGPQRDREFADTIGREAVLASIHEVRRKIPQFFGKRHASALTTEERESIKAFFRDCLTALGRAWNWSNEDRRHFVRDANMYVYSAISNLEQPNTKTTSTGVRSRTMAHQSKRVGPRQHEPPFVGRVALLLDPSMLEQARKAAHKFHGDVEKFAQKVLRETLRPSR